MPADTVHPSQLSSFDVSINAPIMRTFSHTTGPVVTTLLSQDFKVIRLPDTFKKLSGKDIQLGGKYNVKCLFTDSNNYWDQAIFIKGRGWRKTWWNRDLLLQTFGGAKR